MLVLVFICLLVCLYPVNVETACGTSQRKVMDYRLFKNLLQTNFDFGNFFHEILFKICEFFFFAIYKFNLLVCLYPINVYTAEPIKPKFCVVPRMTPRKIYGGSKLQKLCPKDFDFCKILKMREQI